MGFKTGGNGRFRHVLLASLAAFVLIASSGCTRSCGSTPEKAAENYLNAFFENDLDATWNCASERDRAVKERKSYDMIHEVESDTIAAKLAKQAKVSILSTETEGMRAVVAASVVMPRLDIVMGDMLGFAFGAAASGMEYGEFDRALKNRYLKGSIPRGTNPVILFLVREEGDWKVYHGWEMDKALELERWEKYDEALEHWRAVDRIVPGHPVATARIEEIYRKTGRAGPR
ncbi:MAG: hypothetical protein H3C68_07050 [Deltaproteobacteria bacterium]|nr:hypothetical protein [Deltaproteobacteria bacterium]MBZ0219487.1 hypothetical protein [Deltaproteobacteria bacterium]